MAIGELTRRHPGFRPLVLCNDGQRAAIDRAGLPAMSWSELLLGGPPGVDAERAQRQQRKPVE